jgi:ATP-dependent Clp protease adaptor protein ClpS
MVSSYRSVSSAVDGTPPSLAGPGRGRGSLGLGPGRRSCHHGLVSGMMATETEAGTATETRPDTEQGTDVRAALPWVTLVWNDPINLMSYVTHVFQKLFGYDREKATKLMLDVHRRGRAVVSTGSREQMEHDVARLHAYGLWATLQQQ